MLFLIFEKILIIEKIPYFGILPEFRHAIYFSVSSHHRPRELIRSHMQAMDEERLT
jgi:hypothetical protein